MKPELIALKDELFRRAPLEIPEIIRMEMISGDRDPVLDREEWENSPFRQPTDHYPSMNGHLVGCAFDAHWQDARGNWHWCGPKIARLAVSIGLRAGYYFSHSDPNHFDLGLDVILAEHKKQDKQEA